MPMIGAYDTSNPSVASQHLDQAAIGGIDVFSLEWTGPNPSDTGYTETEYDIDNGFLPAWWQKAYVMFYMFYDQAIRMNRKFGITIPEEAYNFNDSRVYNQFISDIDHIREKYFGHLGYFKMDYSPVIFWYLSRITSGPWWVALQTVRDHAGGNIFFIGDEIFNTKLFRPRRIEKFDAISCYGVGLDPTYYSDGANVRDVADIAIPVYEYWQYQASDLGVWFVWPLEAEYDDDHISGRPWNGEFYSFSKSDFSYFAQRIKNSISSRGNPYVSTTSFNEWYETTSVEACSTPGEPYIYNWGWDFLNVIKEIFF
ncbi:MAG: hypothetical protein AB1410_09675 [Acidobacteriota bacterium]